MISVGSRDEKMELEIEEGEAFFQRNYNEEDDSTIDPDVSLSYIDERLQDVLGHCQKEFEGGVSAENLGSKFGGYGSFLPTYQRSPVWPHHPNNAHLEVGNQNLTQPANVGPASFSATSSVAASKRQSKNGKPKQEANGQQQQQPVNNFSNGSDPKSLKVRIKVGPDNQSGPLRNSDIYSGLGLDGSPSSSLEISPVNSDGFFNLPQIGPHESPTSILEIMTSFPEIGSRLLSPLPYDVLHLTEKGSQESSMTAHHGPDLDNNKVDQKPKSTETNNTVSMESTNGIDIVNNIVTKKDNLGCEELVSISKELKGNNGKICDENNNINNNSDVSSSSKNQKNGQKAMKLGLNGNKTSSSSGVKRKSKVLYDVLDNDDSDILKNESFSSRSKNDNKNVKKESKNKDFLEDSKKKSGKVYKDFFGVDLEHEEEEEEDDEKLSLEVDPKLGPHVDQKMVVVNNGVVGPHDAIVAPPVVKEDWVCCDKCEKWRLLPPGVNPGSLPEKWLCSMLTWLPGMNKCSISEEETTKAITSRFPGPSNPPVHHHPGGLHLGDNISIDNASKHHYHPGSGPHLEIPKKKHAANYETKQEKPSLSSNSEKKNLHTSYKKSRSVNHSPQINIINNNISEAEFQDSGHSSGKERLKQKEKNKIFVDEGNNNIHQKIRNKRESSQDFPKDFKKVKTDEDWTSDHGGPTFKPSCSSNSGLNARSRKLDTKVSTQDKENQNQMGSNDGKSNKREVVKKRKVNEFDVKEGNEKEKKARVLSSKASSLAATSSSSKVSGSHKAKETKGSSPVESVSSSPLRILKTEKLTSSRKNVENNLENKKESLNKGKEKVVPFHGQNEEKMKANQSHSGGSRSRKHAKGSLLRSKEKNRSSRSDFDKGVPQTSSEPLKQNMGVRPHEEKSKGGQKVNEKSKHRNHDGGSDVRINGSDVKKQQQQPSSSSKKDVSRREKAHSLPPSGKGQSEKENANDLSKQKIPKNSTPNRNHPINPIPLVMSNQATTNALREATNLKHMADRMKNSGSSLESRALYIQAAFKFLHVASLFESCHSQTGRYGDMIQSMSIYSSTAKLCEYCAHEYERTKEMAVASLAYKCMEVAYLKVIYSSHATACKDVNELQNSLQIGPNGESPSSSASASDLDNMNNQSTVDKAAIAKGANAPQAAGNHVIPARIKPNFTRVLNLAQDVNSAMEASRKSRSCFAASSAKEEAAVKKALDFNFHDVEELLRLVRLAMEVINR